MADHNLLTYKSLHESLDDWVLEELIGYYSNYRKIVSLSKTLLSAEHFQLYTVSTRYPMKLFNSGVDFRAIQPGVYDIKVLSRYIRLIVLSQIELNERNAFWLLFSGKAEAFVYGNEHYHWSYPSEKAVLNQLYELYRSKGAVMPYTMEDFERDFTEEHLYLWKNGYVDFQQKRFVLT